ncbi:MAG: hypothetical protein AMXMBFR33_59480 [Candidatus Xenobia bacterium]
MPGSLLQAAHERRRPLLEALAQEGTDCYRLFHGVAEGYPGLAVDRYGELLFVQTFREPLGDEERAAVERALACWELPVVFRHRPDGPAAPSSLATCHELGRQLTVRTHHSGLDPYLFLDLRVARRWLAGHHQGSLLNLFAYTCAVGVVASGSGSSLNVDFSQRHLEVGARNARLNQIPADRFGTLCEDVLPVLRQLAGLPVKGRGAQRPYKRVEPRQFDTVFLDPPTWSRGRFGAVDIVRDYAALARPALLATRPGGRLVATNHAPEVALAEWLEGLRRCALKWGRRIVEVEVLAPDSDFPSLDGSPPLKIAVLGVS